jgi:hypothetical protein
VFIGHYGVALAAKRYEKRLPLGVLFIAVQALDIMFTLFVLSGVEKMRIVPGFTEYNPYDLYFMPYTHSPVGSIGWSIFGGLLFWLISRKKTDYAGRMALIIGIAVFSHFLLDLPVHTPDMPVLIDESSMKLGLGLWHYRSLSLIAEAACLLVGVWIYLNGTMPIARSGRVMTSAFVCLLAVLLVSTPFMPIPTSAYAFAIQALLAYFLLALLAEWMDRFRPG